MDASMAPTDHAASCARRSGWAAAAAAAAPESTMPEPEPEPPKMTLPLLDEVAGLVDRQTLPYYTEHLADARWLLADAHAAATRGVALSSGSALSRSLSAPGGSGPGSVRKLRPV